MDTTNKAHSLRAIARLLDLLDDEVENLIAAIVLDPGTKPPEVSNLVSFEEDLEDYLDQIRRAITERFPEVRETHPAHQ